MGTLYTIALIVIIMTAFKAVTIGSDFCFFDWFKHGKKYTKWYFNRPKFKGE